VICISLGIGHGAPWSQFPNGTEGETINSRLHISSSPGTEVTTNLLGKIVEALPTIGSSKANVRLGRIDLLTKTSSVRPISSSRDPLGSLVPSNNTKGRPNPTSSSMGNSISRGSMEVMAINSSSSSNEAATTTLSDTLNNSGRITSSHNSSSDSSSNSNTRVTISRLSLSNSREDTSRLDPSNSNRSSSSNNNKVNLSQPTLIRM